MYSQPSSSLSPSLSATHGLVRAVSSMLSGRKSASSSVSVGLAIPSLSQSPPTSGPTIGWDMTPLASRLMRRAMILMRNFLATFRPFASVGSRRSSFFGTITVSCVLVECSERT